MVDRDIRNPAEGDDRRVGASSHLERRPDQDARAEDALANLLELASEFESRAAGGPRLEPPTLERAGRLGPSVATATRSTALHRPPPARHPPPPVAVGSDARGSTMPGGPFTFRPTERMVTAAWAVLALAIVLTAGVLWVQGDELARAVWRGSNGPDRPADTGAWGGTPPTENGDDTVSEGVPIAPDDPRSDEVGDTAPPVSTPLSPAAPPEAPPCDATIDWIANAPPELAQSTVLETRCSGPYAVVQLLLNGELFPFGESIFVTMRDTESGWAVLATTSELDCEQLHEVDPFMPSELCS